MIHFPLISGAYERAKKFFGPMVLLVAFACADDHLVDTSFHCDAAAPLEFNTILPVFISKCASGACHSLKNNYIPRLETKEEIAANRSDCKFQIESGAMPPSGYSLTPAEKEKILCWLNYGI